MNKKYLRIAAYISLAITLVLVIAYSLLQLGSVQNYLKDRVLKVLSERYDAEWSIGEIKINFFDEAVASEILFLDQAGDTLLRADKIEIDIGIFSLWNKEVVLDQVTLYNGYSHLYQKSNGVYNFDFLIKQSEPQDTTDPSDPWLFDLEDLNLRDTKFRLNTVDQSLLILNENLDLRLERIDLIQKQIFIDFLKLGRSEIEIVNQVTTKPKERFSLPDIGWNIEARTIRVDSSYVYSSRGISIDSISRVNLDINTLKYTERALSFNIQNISGVFNDDVSISKLKGNVNLILDDLYLENVLAETKTDRFSIKQLQTNLNTLNSKVKQVQVKVAGRALAQLNNTFNLGLAPFRGQTLEVSTQTLNYENSKVKLQDFKVGYGKSLNAQTNVVIENRHPYPFQLDIINARGNLTEIDNLFPSYKFPDSLQKFKSFEIFGKITGDIQNVMLSEVQFQMDDLVRANISGRIRNITDKENFTLDLAVEQFSAQLSELPYVTNDALAIDSLGKVNYSGQINGGFGDLNIDGTLQSNLGRVVADITMDLSEESKPAYNGTIEFDDFDLGVLLRRNDIGVLNLSTTIYGSGFDLDRLDSKINGEIINFDYRGYTYDNLTLDARIADRSVNGKLKIFDSNIQLEYSGLIKLDSVNTIFDFEANIDTLNLKELGLYKDNVSLSGKVLSSFSLPLRSGEKGYVDIYNFRISNQNESFLEDSIQVEATKRSDSTFLSVRTGFMNLDMQGSYGIRTIPSIFNKFARNYLNRKNDSLDVVNSGQSIQLSGEINTLIPLDIFLGKQFVQAGKVIVDMNIDAEKYSGKGSMRIDSFFYNDIFSEKILISYNAEQEELNVNMDAENNDLKGTLVPVLSLKNDLSDGKIQSSFLAQDDDRLPRLKFLINTAIQEDQYQFRFKDSLILNRKNWFASRDNQLILEDGRVIISDLELTDNNEFLRIETRGENNNNLILDFNNFNIGQFATLLTSEPSKFSGNINGSASIRDFLIDPFFFVNLTIDDIIYDKTSVGVLMIEAEDDPRTSTIRTKLNLSGLQNEINGEGTYNTKTRGVDFQLNISALQMRLLDPFLSEIMRSSKGVVSGKTLVTGTIDQPKINGEIILDDVVTTIVINNSTYGIDDHTITFDNSSIDIGSIDIFDTQNNVAFISGKIYHTFLEDIFVDLDLTTEKFAFLNTTATDNPVFHGKLVLDADASISGPVDNLDVQINAKTLDSTSVTISPFSIEKYLIEESFISYGKPSDFQDLTDDYLLKFAKQYPFNVNILLGATKEAKLNLVVDPVTGDKIEGNGSGNLVVNISPDGQQEIFGTYQVNDGSYSFSYGDLVSKQFAISQGGSVKFNGNPLSAELDINAVYSVYTTPYELIKNELATNDGEISAAQERTNVEVHLSLQGTLQSPQIELDIQIPDLQSRNLVSAIDRKLNELRNDPNELNNQVFGLLIFDSFILSDNVSSGFGSLGSSIALSSVSSLISNQLNNFANDLISGVDISINVNSYESNYTNEGAGGNVTEVGLQVSKQLFNNRLKVSAGGNFDFSQGLQPTSYSSFIGDFVLEYLLTEDGRYRVRVFSKADYDRLLNENTNRNGVSLFFNKSFDSKLDEK